MSTGRRKNKNPQRLEDLKSPDEKSVLSDNGSSIIATTPKVTVSIDVKSSTQNESKMTILDVLQGLRKGFFSECVQCHLALKDWQSTLNHIHKHRLSYVPKCIDNSTNGIYSCAWCSCTFKDAKLLVLHTFSKHPFSFTQSFTCSFCKEAFDYCEDLQHHFDIKCIHMKCPVCSAVYDQEYKLFSHLVICLLDFHPHLKTLNCHVCCSSVPLSTLADHMINHSLASTAELARLVEKSNITVDSSASQLDSFDEEMIFLCEFCDERFEVFRDFENHLSVHSNSKSESCPLCLLKGFTKSDLLVRHLFLRCPRRSKKQLALASYIIDKGKGNHLFFLDLICCLRRDKALVNANNAWNSIKIVTDFLTPFIGASMSEVEYYSKRSFLHTCNSCPPPSDVELIQRLSKYEANQQRRELSLGPDASKDMATWIPPKNVSIAEYDAMLATFYKSINDSKASENPINFSLQKPPLDAEVKISAVPPNECKQVLENYENANKAPPTLPSIEYIKKNYPGVVLLPEVDLEALCKVSMEAEKEKQRDWVKEAIESGLVTQEDLSRLELEAQHLRQLDPFYTVSKPSLEFSVLRQRNKCLEDPTFEADPERMRSLLEQAKDLMNNPG